jgi:hypothetical protein
MALSDPSGHGKLLSMKTLFIYLSVVLIAVFASTQMSVGDLMPAPSASQREKLRGFAEMTGAWCSWPVPTVWQYLRAGRPQLLPNAVCTLRASSAEPDPVLQAVTMRETLYELAEPYLGAIDFAVGFRFSNAGSLLTCFSPQKSIAWSRCQGTPELGCLLTNCNTGLPPR